MSKQYFVYMTTNTRRSVLYTGITSDLVKRMFQHKQKQAAGFTRKYNADRLVYFEVYEDPQTAIQREKSIKNLLRRKKEALIDGFNPEWKDLTDEIA